MIIRVQGQKERSIWHIARRWQHTVRTCAEHALRHPLVALHLAKPLLIRLDHPELGARSTCVVGRWGCSMTMTMSRAEGELIDWSPCTPWQCDWPSGGHVVASPARLTSQRPSSGVSTYSLLPSGDTAAVSTAADRDLPAGVGMSMAGQRLAAPTAARVLGSSGIKVIEKNRHKILGEGSPKPRPHQAQPRTGARQWPGAESPSRILEEIGLMIRHR